MTLKEIIDKTTGFFEQKNIPTARLDTELLLSHALNYKRIDLYVNFEKQLNEKELTSCRELVKRRALGEPVAYILGEKEFYGLNFQVAAGVLVPRPETEHLVDGVLDWVKNNELTNKPIKIIDMGCGSGCIAIALLKKLPFATAIAVDASDIAIKYTQQNAQLHDVADRIQVKKVDLNADAIEGLSADIVVSNPPYIAEDDEHVQASVKEFEPNEALFAKDAGLFSEKKWFQHAMKFVENSEEKKFIAFEFGSSQKQNLQEFFKSNWSQLTPQFKRDYADLDRYFIVEV